MSKKNDSTQQQNMEAEAGWLAKEEQHSQSDHGRDRTCNLLIPIVAVANRSQAPCHWATRPTLKRYDQHAVMRLSSQNPDDHHSEQDHAPGLAL
jgi:hypothetical protein